MAGIDSLARQVQALQAKVSKPAANFLDNPEWPQILAVCRSVLPAYPAAYQATEQAIHAMVAPMGWIQVREMLMRALVPYVDARIALAAALMELSKQREGG